MLNLEQHTQLVEAARGKPFKHLLSISWLTGARPGELRSLKWEHISKDCCRATLVQHKTAKSTERPRVIYFNTEARRLLAELKAESESDYVFLNRFGKPFTKDALVRRMANLQTRTGVRAISYAFRHSFITRAILAGESIGVVAELVGTSSEMIARTYSHLDKAKDHLRDAAERL